MEGSDKMAVASTLRQQGLLVIEVKEQGIGQKDILEPFKKVKLADLVVFTRQFATMINAGLPIVRALYVLTEQTDNKKLKETLDDVRRDVEAGLALSEALEKHPKVFNKLYTEMVRAGETGGILDDVLLRIASQLEKDQELRRKVKSAMTYPTVVLVLAILAASFMLIFIVPIFAQMFEDLGGTLPLPTRVAMSLSDILTSVFGIFIYAGMGLGVFLFLRWRKTENGRKAVDPAMLKIPAKIGDIIQKVALARFARTLGTLSAAGVPILQALEITATSSGNYVLEKALLKSREAVREGLPIYRPLEEEPVFPPIVTRMIAVGEETGDIDGMLKDRRVLRVGGRRGGKSPDLYHRAPHDRGRRRHRRWHHRGDVPAYVPDLRADRVALKGTEPEWKPPTNQERAGGSARLLW
jgi:type IV pilus assembly protein PilC